MPLFRADLVLPVSSPPIPDGWVHTADDGTILETGQGPAPSEAIQLQGILVPGFVNAHCHLELSFLKGKIPRGLGMTGFIRELMLIRAESSPEQQEAGMREADDEMYRNGIVATGDISNAAYSATLKAQSEIDYRTFLEVSGLAPEKAAMLMEQARDKRRVFELQQQVAGLTPHAPYSVSSELMQTLVKEIQRTGFPLSIHLQESEDELEFCRSGNGPMGEFFRKAGFNTTAFPYSNTTPVRNLLPLFQHIEQVLLVHNTFITAEDIRWAEETHPGITWCLCPNANRYITGQLPPVDVLAQQARCIAIGTDSLASNESLSIVSELAVLQQAFPQLSFETLLQWATLNGARSLQKENKLGSFEKGKKPGIILLQNIHADAPAFTSEVKVQRIL